MSSLGKYLSRIFTERILQRGLIQLMLLLGGLFMPIACSKDKDIPVIINDMKVSFSIGELSGWTRNTDTAAALENKIYDFAIYLLDGEGNVLQKLPVFFTELIEIPGTNSSSYRVTCNISKMILNSLIESGANPAQIPVKILMVANWESGGVSYPRSTEEGSLTFSEIAKTELKKFDIQKGIPMYGLLSSIIDTTAKNGSDDSLEIGTILLLRSVAKVEIIHNLIGAQYSGNGIIKDVDAKLLNIPGSLFSGPRDYDSDTDSWITDNIIDPLSEIKKTHIPEEVGLVNVMPQFMGETLAGKSSISFYPAEVEMVGLSFFNPDDAEPSVRPVIKLELTVSYDLNGEEVDTVRPFYLQFTNYDENGKPLEAQAWPRLIRNTAYRFEIQGIVSHEILFKVSVENWTNGGEAEIDM